MTTELRDCTKREYDAFIATYPRELDVDISDSGDPHQHLTLTDPLLGVIVAQRCVEEGAADSDSYRIRGAP